VDTAEILTQHAEELIDAATQAVLGSRLTHYTSGGHDALRGHIAALYGCLLRCVSAEEAAPMVAHARSIADQRYATGFELQEVQTAINMLESTVWRHLVRELPAASFADAIGGISSILGMGKDALAQSYVALAAGRHAKALDTPALFRGTDGV
jgi:hypothetical protein